jgi:hypothetical protein
MVEFGASPGIIIILFITLGANIAPPCVASVSLTRASHATRAACPKPGCYINIKTDSCWRLTVREI